MLAGGFSLESDWQQVCSGLQDSREYSCRFQQWSHFKIPDHSWEILGPCWTTKGVSSRYYGYSAGLRNRSKRVRTSVVLLRSLADKYPKERYHHVVPPARISLTLSRHSSLSFIASGSSSGLHPVSSQSCCMYVRAGRPAFVRPYEGVYWSTSLMSSSLLLQQCPTCLVRLTWIVFVMGGKWPYSWCFEGCCLHILFNIARSIFV